MSQLKINRELVSVVTTAGTSSRFFYLIALFLLF
jgi:hypothetical protein